MHAGATAIRLGTGLVAVAAHSGAGLITSKPACVLAVNGLVLNPSIAADQALIAVAASVGYIRPVAVVSVIGRVAGVVAVPVVVIAVPGDVCSW